MANFIGKRASYQTEAPLYDEPDSFMQCAQKDDDIELKECPAYEKPKKDVYIELEECPAYGKVHGNQLQST